MSCMVNILFWDHNYSCPAHSLTFVSSSTNTRCMNFEVKASQSEIVTMVTKVCWSTDIHPCIGSTEITLCVLYCKYFKHDYYICVMRLWVNTNPPFFKSLDHILIKTVPKYIQFKSIPFLHWDQHFSMTLLFPSFSFLSCGTLASPCW